MSKAKKIDWKKEKRVFIPIPQCDLDLTKGAIVSKYYRKLKAGNIITLNTKKEILSSGTVSI